MKNIGLKPHRLIDNPLERFFAEEWEALNERSPSLERILSAKGEIANVTARDRVVAATIIQWLGSPVGSNFVKRVLEREVEIGHTMGYSGFCECGGKYAHVEDEPGGMVDTTLSSYVCDSCRTWCLVTWSNRTEGELERKYEAE